MRKLCLLPLCIFAVACGGGGGNNPPPDSPPPGDGPGVDMPGDMPVDMPPGGASRVWAVGDFLVDNARVAGAFDDGATLPFNTATPPPIVMPGGTSVLFSGTGATANVFDARGDKIAFVADLEAAGQFNLYAANKDGSAPLKLVDGVTGVEITSVQLSPDGTKVGFLMDSAAVDNGFDLYVVPTAGGTAVKLSPDRPVASTNKDQQDVFFQFSWSRDSKLIAYSADLTENAFDQAYVADTTAAAPTSVELLKRDDIATQAAGAQGVRGNLLFDDQNNIFFRARVTAGSTNFTLFKSDAAGVKTALALPARGDTTVPDVGAFGITPDGKKLLFSADAPTALAFDVYSQDTANPAAAVKLTNLTGPGHTDFVSPLFFSADGSKVAMVANFLTALRQEPFVMNIDGSDFHRLFAVDAACGACDANQLAWTVDGAALYLAGDINVNNDAKVFRLDPAMTDQAPTLAVDVPTGGDIINLFVVPQ